MTDRIFASIVMVVALVMALAATQIQESFIQDPLGPKAFPILIAGLMAAAAVVMLVKPDRNPHWPSFKKVLELLGTTGVLVAYAYLLPLAGFVLATAVATAFLCGRLGANLRQSVQGGLLTSVGIYLVFQWVLGINLAKGPWGF
jgi:putative tricarboxylic transport membrane protein